MSVKKLIIANWKANPRTVEEALRLARSVDGKAGAYKKVDTVIAPPFPFLEDVGGVLKKLALGAQDVFWKSSGPYTGEVALDQLKALHVQYVIVGHSERRMHLGESDEVVNKKLQAVVEYGLTAVLCVGERERVGNEIPIIVETQIKNALAGIKKNFLKNVIIAYEPVWAISTTPNARPDTPTNAQQAMLYIRKVVSGLYASDVAGKIRVIYGGSVKKENIASFLEEGRMDGALVGGSSLDAEEFIEIVARANQ